MATRRGHPVDPEIQAERQRALVEMLTSEGWRAVARPALQQHLAQMARSLAVARTAPLERLRELQAEYNLIARLVEKPKSFFLGPSGQEETDAAMAAEYPAE